LGSEFRHIGFDIKDTENTTHITDSLCSLVEKNN